MAEIKAADLFGRLNSLGYKSFESAMVFCKLRKHSKVELVHWIQQLLQVQDSDLHRIIKHFDIEPARLARDVIDVLDRMPAKSTTVSGISPTLLDSVERGWVYGSLMFGEYKVRTGYVILGMLKTPGTKDALPSISKEFEKIESDALSVNFSKIVDGSPEEDLQRREAGRAGGGGAAPGEASGAMAPAGMGKGEALAQFSVDLTERAREGEIDPIVGRDEEIRQIVDILMRRRQNNPIITGEAGVGKTAVVEGFALRIAAGEVPPPLQNVELRSLDIGLLQAGASMKGEFEERLRQVIEEVQSSETPIIMFIDEAHTLIGAGGSAGTGDAANLLKPALARGTLRTIAATTWAEYKKHIEKDPALTRRFQVIAVDEPSEEKAILMMRGLASTLEQHHKVQVLDEALEASVRLSHRYIPARQLPDKSISLLDTACARVAISHSAIPAELDDTRRRIEALERELKIIAKEKVVGVESADQREAEATEKLEADRTLEGQLEERYEKEKGLVDEILAIRDKLRGSTGKVEGTGSELEEAADAQAEDVPVEKGPAADEPAEEIDRDGLIEKLHMLQGELAEVQGESPLILPSVDYQAVASVVGDWTGIPVGRMVKNQVEAILKLADTMGARVVGQDHALEMIARRVQTSRAKLDNPNKPIGVFMLAGPSGVGKTETALALAESLYGGEQNVITINMSEFQESHTVSTLKGAPPGYVGYGEGGILTEAVRRRPYSVVLLDEVEKAHSDVHEIFFQVFDKGQMEDGEGRLIDFKNTLILLTSNVGSELIMNMCNDPELLPDAEGIAKSMREPLLKVFPAALLGRIVVIPYYPLTDDVIGLIAKLQLGRIEQRILMNHKVPFTYDDEVIKTIVDRCQELESGGRMIDAILTNTVLPKVSTEILNCMMAETPIERVHISVENEEFQYSFNGG